MDNSTRLLGAAIALVVASCGGDGGGDSSPPAADRVLYVRASGNDGNSGATPSTALRTVAHAVERLAPGTTVIVGPGRYVGRVEIAGVAGTAAQPVRFVADRRGTSTDDRNGDVILDAGGDLFSLRISRSTFVTIDGFSLVGAAPSADASVAGLQIRNESHNASVRHCTITTRGLTDGVRVQNSNDVLLFNNLVYEIGRGIRIADGSRGARLINNTVTAGKNIAVLVGGTNADGAAATGATLLNNVLQPGDGRVTVRVDEGPPSAREGYVGNFNLSFVASLADQANAYQPADIRGADDVNESAVFHNAARAEFHLDQARSPAVDAGTDEIPMDLLTELQARSTARDGRRDTPPIDLGYHYPVP